MQKLYQFWKPQKFLKAQKPRSNAWRMNELGSLPVKKNTWSRPKNIWGWSLEWERGGLGGEEAKAIERDQREMKLDSCGPYK